MQDWQLEFEWLRIRHSIKEALGREDLPDLNAILLLIGVQEYGHIKEKFTKEEKQDLMHIGVCTLLSLDGYFEFKGRDEEGWPHFEEVAALKVSGVEAQEKLLMEKVIQYFDQTEEE